MNIPYPKDEFEKAFIIRGYHCKHTTLFCINDIIYFDDETTRIRCSKCSNYINITKPFEDYFTKSYKDKFTKDLQ